MSIVVPPFLIVDQWSFEFETVEVEAVSSAGAIYKRRVWIGMPKIPPQILNSVFYLYHSRKDAEAGEPVGGTGFFFAVPTLEGTSNYYYYAVTNWHVAVRGGASVIRVNRRAGGVDIIELSPEDWTFIPNGPDLAVADVELDGNIHNLVCLQSELVASQEFIRDASIGAGEDIFMVGRFVDHDGPDENIPAVRFGHISVMPQHVEQPTGANDRRSYILDIHSRTGFSGSPVFAYRTPLTDMEARTGPLPLPGQAPIVRFIKLLGVHWGQFPERWEIDSHETKQSDSALPITNKYIRGWSGMSLAIPAEEILEVLSLPKLKSVRDKAAARIRADVAGC